MKKLIVAALLMTQFINAQDYFPNNNDISAVSNQLKAITGATIITKPGEQLKNATILIENGKIKEIGINVKIPKNAVIENAAGMYIYPSFIESYSDLAITAPKSVSRSGAAQYDESRQGFYWNDHIRSEQRAINNFKYNKKAALKMINAGYGVVQSHITDGIARGTGILIALNNNAGDDQRILKIDTGDYYSLTRSMQTKQSYPTSLMGTLALLRQFHYDSDWYAAGHAKTKDLSIEAMLKNKSQIQFIEAGDKKNILRADKLGDKIGKQYVIIGGEDAYEMIDAIKKTDASLILPVNFPAAYDVTDPSLEWYVNLSDMREWKQAPSNPFLLSQAGINYAITTHGLKKPETIHAKMRAAIERGLTADQALASLTTIPAQLLNTGLTGTLEKGSWANFIVTSDLLFKEKTKLFENWVQGSKHIIKDRTLKDIDGDYTAMMANKKYNFKISGTGKTLAVKQDTTKVKSKMSYDGSWINMTITAPEDSFYRLTLQPQNASLNGTLYNPDGNTSAIALTKGEDKKEEKEDKKGQEKETIDIGAIMYPNIGFGNKNKPVSETVLFKNATVWTNEADGILKTTDVLVKNGKIASVGTNLSSRGARVYDGTGMHLTSGIVDEHSHIAIDNGVNEAGHNSTAEVTIEDVVDHEDINLYRNLAGGVTSAQLLHGSANPIGGRSAIIKLKWGYEADELIYKNSPKFIKFALGENVKQSRYQNGTRFPQTRMGVEQVFEDYFTRAREYENSRNSSAFRYDEELETLSEILKEERFISCHSYIVSEINMLMELADRYGFTVNTFTHILEGYKIADKMAQHGAGGSTFSDWWAYKYEVNDAIPYNGAIMHSQGVTVAFNSDDAEMSRRLNQEAAKAIKYGNVSEEDAWKFVTLNPAKLLHIDDRVGSIKVGKDADLVLWNNHPLSIQARSVMTMIDGAIFFERDKDLRLRESIKKERQLLINEMIAAKNKGLKTQPAKQSTKTIYECETIHW